MGVASGDCSAGYYCVGGAQQPSPTDNITGNVCPMGSACPAGSHTPILCLNGTYANHTGAADCYTCPAGFFCVAGDNPVQCPTGYFCPEGTGILIYYTQYQGVTQGHGNAENKNGDGKNHGCLKNDP